ncbi:GAK system ATP-grasp enzyme [Desulfomicrobium sp. ZS1]|jgi:ribosomal protein S6--L-glutamate ligase|uniref:GAK system ATP-grasp enzyme n=1 Tax=Desulfomicrobium sp. ZS1 TaxID=2952228 RepID=UPI0020B44AAD|nr:GAK system ATP-grasp enzyme [Desulfomicrobium sp. ZS1]UTF49554.1 GAK system ATP-grasp enzyme [Desulfomicrobium sp. ZS1]
MKIGVVGTRGGWSSELLADTVAAKTGFRLLVDMEQVCMDLDAGKVWTEGVDLGGLDGLIIKKIGARYSPDLLDRLEVLRFLAQRGLSIFSSPMSIMRVLDRLSCTVTLRLGDIPMPPTTITESVDEALGAVERYGSAVFKPLFTSKARGMTVIEHGAGARLAIEAFHAENPIMYMQQKIELPGQDLGIVFLGGKYLTTYARCGTGAWNTTTESGGKYAPATPSSEALRMAEQAQALFDLDFTCVDVVEAATGPVVFEVSAFGGFRGIQDACGLDAAAMYTDYVMEKIRER